MPHRIEVGFGKDVTDVLGQSTRKSIAENMGIKADSVRTIDVYTIDAELTEIQLEETGKNLFADSVTQEYSIDRPLARDFDWLIEVGFKPGVADNAGRTSKEAVEDILKTKVGGVYTSKQYIIKGRLSMKDVERIASGLLANGLIQRWEIRSAEEWDRGNGIDTEVPAVKLEHEPRVREINIDVPDRELARISREGTLALSLEEMKAIHNHYKNPGTLEERKKFGLGKNPTDVELEALAQTWSEHCKHKIFNAVIDYREGGRRKRIDSLFKTFVKASTEKIAKPWLVSVFRDNAGIIRFDSDWNLAMKVETHNTPSALEPYGGALTGIVGVNRDSLGTGKGARLIFNTDVFCFASPFYSKPLPPRLMHPKRMFEGVRKGVEHGGNKSGIPTVNGSIVFDDRFLGKPLVYCGTGAIMPARVNGEGSEIKKVEAGDLAVMCGGRVGKDGIHGATFSSEELHEGSPATAVQIGDPITQKKMADFLLEARDLGLYRTLTDNGAGGLSSSIGELAQLSGGCEIYLERCPLKYPGLDPWEVLLSESQERMTVVVPPEKIDGFLGLAERREVESSVVGKFTGSGRFHVSYNGKTVAFLEMGFLHEGVPQMKLSAEWRKPAHKEPDFACPTDLGGMLEKILGRLNICSKEYVVRQYDHEVQGTSVIKPLVGAANDGPSDAAVLRPVLGSMEGIVIAHGICPRYGDIDTYHMAANAIDEAVRNFVSVGGDIGHLAGLDNFCWCDPMKSEKNPDGRYKLAQLVRANQALYDMTTAYGVPCISGKDSMKNDCSIGNVRISIPPTLLFSVVGKIGDVEKAVTMDVKAAGDAVFVLGLTKAELGASEYFAMNGFVGNSVPQVDAKSSLRLYKALGKAIQKGLVRSCHDCSDGGLAVALAESAFAGALGMGIDLRKVPRENIERDDFLLFSESAGRFVVTVRPKDVESFERTMKGNVFARIGAVRDDGMFVVRGLEGDEVINMGIPALKEAWQRTLRW